MNPTLRARNSSDSANFSNPSAPPISSSGTSEMWTVRAGANPAAPDRLEVLDGEALVVLRAARVDAAGGGVAVRGEGRSRCGS